jgi:hypothetical protein
VCVCVAVRAFVWVSVCVCVCVWLCNTLAELACKEKKPRRRLDGDGNFEAKSGQQWCSPRKVCRTTVAENLQNGAASSAGRDFNDNLCDSLVILTAQSEALLNNLLREETVYDNDPFTHRRLLFLTS